MHDKVELSNSTISTIHSSRRTSDTPLPLGQLGHPGNAALLEEMYEQWKLGAESLSADWKAFFEGFELGSQLPPPTGAPPPPSLSSSTVDSEYRLKQARVYNLLFAYRTLGHMKADLDPLDLAIPTITDLELSNFKFTQNDLDLTFDAGTLAGGGELKLREIVRILDDTYCRHVAVEYMHIQNFTVRRWLRDRMEKCQNTPAFSRDKQIRILNKLLSSELFERFLHTRYVGQKRFSLEGGETLIPILDAIVESSPSYGIEQIVMGMSHRGRLNVLVNILGKSYRSIFNEFAENHMPETVQGDGDVKYHLGFESVVTTSSGEKVTISLAPNPSHLEAVDPVVEGKARARQRLLNDMENRSRVIPLLVHGDAAFIGQGIVAETFNLSQLEGYRTGGTIHLVVNNQIGFTTSPKDGRSTVYCTALAKTLGVPIFHVNGDDPLACVYTLELALAFRQRFKKDVIVDMYCYRRRGHNEGDEPNYTQPILYSAIENHNPVSHVFLDALVVAGTITRAEAENFQEKYNQKLSMDLGEAKAESSKVVPSIRKPISTPELLAPVDSAVPLEKLQTIGRTLTNEPPGVNLNSKILTLLKNRRAMVEGTQLLDWGCAESLAFGSILMEGIPVRLSGQDSRRGTFSHRHSALYDINTRERYIPLKHVSLDQASFCVYNSPLSEAAVLGFDFGYSLDCPNLSSSGKPNSATSPTEPRPSSINTSPLPNPSGASPLASSFFSPTGTKARGPSTPAHVSNASSPHARKTTSRWPIAPPRPAIFTSSGVRHSAPSASPSSS